MWWISAVVVDLPFEPVMVTRGVVSNSSPFPRGETAEEQADVVIDRDAQFQRLGDDRVGFGYRCGIPGEVMSALTPSQAVSRVRSRTS